MFNRYKTKSFLSNFTYSCKSHMSECKLRLIITYVLLVLGLFIGVFVAVRLNNDGILDKAGDYGFVDFSLSNVASFSSFFKRLLSFAVLGGLICLFSLTIFLYPIAEIILIYRAYLIGLNLVIIIICGGLGGLFTSLLIILPCQLVAIMILSTMFCIFSKQAKCSGREKWKTVGICFALLLVVDIVETILLSIFSANIILVL